MLLGLGMIQEAARFANDFQFDDDEFTSELQKERQNYRFGYLSILHQDETFFYSLCNIGCLDSTNY